MTRRTTMIPILLMAWLALSFQAAPQAATPQAGTAQAAASKATVQKAMELGDILAWKNIGVALLSPDGGWLAYRLSPLDGDSEVVVRQTQGDKAYRFPVGDTRGTPGSLAISDDSKWVAFSVAPTKKEAAQLKKQRKPLQNKVTILNLSDGSDTKLDKIQRFAFSGEKASWIALKKYGPDTPGGGGGAAPSGPPAPGGGVSGSGSAADDKPKGTDLILHELGSGAELNVGNVNEFAFDKSGRFLAVTIDATDKLGNGIVLHNLETGTIAPLDSGKASYERLSWTEKGDGLAVLKGTEDKRYKDKVYAVVAFTKFSQPRPEKTVYDPANDKAFPEGMAISPNRTPTWTEDLSALLFGIRKPKNADPRPDAKADAKADPKSEVKPAVPDVKPETPPAADTAPDEEKPDLVIWHYKDPRLQSQQQVQEEMDKNFSFLSIYRVAEKKFIRLADDAVRTVTPAPKEKYAVGLDIREYELSGNLDGRNYQDVYVINLQTGDRKLALKKARWANQASTDGTRFLYYEDGHYFVYDMASGESMNITKTVATSFINTEDDHNVVKPPQPALGWTKDGDAVLLSDGWDLWKVPATAGSPAVNLTVNGKKDGIRYRRLLRLDPDEKGWDFSVPRYVDMFGEFTKKGGFARLDPGKAGVQPLLWDAAAFGMQKAKKADVYVYTKSTPSSPADYYATDATLKPGKKLTALDEQVKGFAWSSGAQIISYTVTLGKNGPTKKLQGSLYLPANYVKGKTYPTLVYIYEKLTQGHHAFTNPSANGFNKSVYTSNGYAVLMPDIAYRLNDPGMSAVWCLTGAVKAAIATGVVDPKRIGLQGHSWGGYQTAFTITQTDLFAAAVAGAPLTDMVSMYSLIYKNSGGTNQAIFESSQGRFLGGYWDNWEAYVRNSPVNFARNVKTPLVILHNDKDGAVDFTQGVEYFNTLRRLGKPVVMLEYPGENHGLAKPANQQDYTVRMKEFFDYYLMGKPAPDWWTKGVPRLEMADHIKQRLDAQNKK
ncbi:MAG TPA: prolyl oligopeptidase family serine peptidase [Vicinamibacterales bacterium]